MLTPRIRIENYSCDALNAVPGLGKALAALFGLKKHVKAFVPLRKSFLFESDTPFSL